jgi:hypothetical protein
MSKTQAVPTPDVGASLSDYERLASINLSDLVEKRNNFSYLSWSLALDQLLRQDPNASWHYHWFDAKPYCVIGDTAMVFCSVTAFGIERTAQLAVMDYKMKSVALPIDSQTLNTSMMRALAKAISLHGLGLYLYSGEDTPLEYGNETNSDSTPVPKEKSVPAKAVAEPSPVAPKPVAKVQCLGENEIKTIRELAEKVGVNELVIAKAYKVDTLAEVPLAKTAQIISKLQEKAAKAVTETETTE